MENDKHKKKIQQKYRMEIKKKRQNNNTHIFLIVIAIVVLLLAIISLYLGVLGDGSEFHPRT
ncbi:hypothetical protein MUN89_18055 [Halobacillus salinarum]|uniref:Uncharacterized protein n=1 Tax=Halobacillus salinarum TaxID=2932257 RepID=A0ABY4EH18_9BACI|nr:hypothetical protein [Halobacillus salinarum]UOQ43765.1 hypothetical protein MUN89_18055 [Halobacillus salinarum]